MLENSLEKYKGVRQDISKIKQQLDDLEEKKEYWFQKKELLKKEINIHIQKIKEIKTERDKRNIELEELRKQRDRYNSDVKHLIKKIKKLNEEKAETFKKYNIKVDPAKIQEKINELERKVELEVNFEKEKKLMDEIKKLKKSYEEGSGVIKIAEEANAIENELSLSRNKADEFHRKIILLAKDTTYDIFIEISRKINELKSEQEAAFQKFIDHKKEYADASTELRKRFDELHVFEKIIGKNKELVALKRKEEQKVFLREKTKLVEEKIRNKKKLTTEDLLTLQGMSDETIADLKD